MPPRTQLRRKGAAATDRGPPTTGRRVRAFPGAIPVGVPDQDCSATRHSAAEEKPGGRRADGGLLCALSDLVPLELKARSPVVLKPCKLQYKTDLSLKNICKIDMLKNFCILV